MNDNKFDIGDNLQTVLVVVAFFAFIFLSSNC